MIYTSMRDCVEDLERNGHLIRISEELDPNQEMAEVHRRVFEAQGPALLFERVKGSPFPAVSNLFGTLSRSRFIFRSTLKWVKQALTLKAEPIEFLKSPWRFAKMPYFAYCALPQKVANGPVTEKQTTIDKLPQIKCWPDDGGAFILLPQVYSEDPDMPGIMHSNLGMYRIQISGNNYQPNTEIGLHYQIRRDIGIHHSKAIEKGIPFYVSIFIGGPPAHTFAAVMPLPSNIPEVTFAGMLGGRRFKYLRHHPHVLSADADFCICGRVADKETRPEGPFGDHLGYYSLKHEFPFIKIDSVYHRHDAIWPFTVVGRPPQEDTSFGKLIHEITGPLVPDEIPGLTAIHAVDAAGVHPLLLAIGRETYIPYQTRQPRELITIANAVLGYGHCSLAKYLLIVAHEDNPRLDINAVPDFFVHLLERVDWRTDIHFLTRTTIDTLDYSGNGLNSGSKVIFSAAGPKKRTLASHLPKAMSLPDRFRKPSLAMPGIMIIEAPPYGDPQCASTQIGLLAQHLKSANDIAGIALIVLVDDSVFCSKTINNFLWTTFTRSNPSHDIYGIDSFTIHKHWGCKGSLIIDARLKPHHATPVTPAPNVTRRVNELAKRGGCLHQII